MPETFDKLQLDRNDDFDYLRASGLIVKDLNPKFKTCQVNTSHTNMAKKFLKGRRRSEELRRIRREEQKQLDRNEIFNNL